MNGTDPHRRRLDDLAELAHEVADVAEALTGGTDRTDGDSSAALLRTEAALLTTGEAMAVCAGEKKRGKSTLINALAEWPGLLPVDADVATSVHVLVRHGDKPNAVVHRLAADAPDADAPDADTPSAAPTASTVPLEQIGEYAALDPKTQRPRHDDVSHLDVAVPAELLRPGLVLVDTPGVGGLVSGHAQLTMAALRRADALIFVVDGSSELTRSELTFLERATQRIATVVFVLTKTDKYPQWRDTMERNRTLIAERAPQYTSAPWFAVSGASEEDALAADRAGDAKTARRRRTAGGFDQLRPALGQLITDRVLDLRMANGARVVRDVLDPLAAQARRLLDSATGGSASAAEVERLQEALTREKHASAGWRNTVTTRMNRLEAGAQLRYRRSVNDLRATAEDMIAASDSASALEDLPDEMQKGVRAAWVEMETLLADGVREIVEETGREISTALGTGTQAPGLALPARLRELAPLVHASHDQRGPAALLERVMPAWGAGLLTSAVVAIVTGGVFAPIVAGFGVVAVLSGRRRRRDELMRVRADANRYVNRLVNELLTEVPPLIKQAVEQLREELIRLITAALEQRTEELTAELEQHRKILAQEKAEQARLAAAARAQHEVVEELRARLDALVPQAAAPVDGAA